MIFKKLFNKLVQALCDHEESETHVESLNSDYVSVTVCKDCGKITRKIINL